MKILVVGLNPACQKALRFEKLTLNDVNRARSLTIGLGGKGVQFAKALNTISPGTVTVAQFVGGYSGKFLVNTLHKMGISQLNVHTSKPTRTCVTLLCDATQHTTELIEPSGEITAPEVKEMREKILGALPGVEGVAMCGTFPPGVTSELHAEIALQMPKTALLLLDGYKDIEPILKTKRVDILKINQNELAALTHTKSIEEGVKMLIYKYNIKWVAITAGPYAAHLFIKDTSEHFVYQIPKMDIKNPIGAGDTVSAILLNSLCLKTEVSKAYRLALAAGCASCLYEEGGMFDIPVMHKIANLITVTKTDFGMNTSKL